jgi:hypothetical protein
MTAVSPVFFTLIVIKSPLRDWITPVTLAFLSGWKFCAVPLRQVSRTMQAATHKIVNGFKFLIPGFIDVPPLPLPVRS